MTELPCELLAPAGSWESMTAAFRAGADAVYMGGPRFGARAYAENPDEDGLLAAIDLAHLHGKRLYLTVNTLMKERELQEELGPYLEPLYRQGLDAVIVQDLGVLAFIRNGFPDLDIHVSTQMTVASPWGARQTEQLGACRLVLPRELSLEEIAAIHQATGQEIEVFIHGALCYCYSGQCLLSSLIGGRSGNRGRCAQPCRLPYNDSHLLNLKDLCTLDILPEILEAGVYSLKIEGRMKSPRYTAGVTRVYRKYVDRFLTRGHSGYRVDEADRELLRQLFDRGGFTEGYFRQHNGAEMIYTGEKPRFRETDEARLRKLDAAFLTGKYQEPVSGHIRIIPGEPVFIEVKCNRTAVRHTGPEVSPAKSRPLTRKDVERCLQKTGDAPFVFGELTVELEENAFLPVGILNRLRREVLADLEKEICGAYRRVR